MESWKIVLIIALVLAVVWSNIALLKYSAKFDMKKFNQDPIEKAKKSLAEKEDSSPAETSHQPVCHQGNNRQGDQGAQNEDHK